MISQLNEVMRLAAEHPLALATIGAAAAITIGAIVAAAICGCETARKNHGDEHWLERLFGWIVGLVGAVVFKIVVVVCAAVALAVATAMNWISQATEQIVAIFTKFGLLITPLLV